MITQDYINGYVNALNTIISALEQMEQDAIIASAGIETTYVGIGRSLAFVKEVKENYRKLIEELNKH